MPRAKKVHVTPAHHEVVEEVKTEPVIEKQLASEHAGLAAIREVYNQLSAADKLGQRGKFLQFQFLTIRKGIRGEVKPL